MLYILHRLLWLIHTISYSLGQVGEILGHTLRVLQLSLSPDETTVASISGDETLRFWRVFPPNKSSDDLRKAKSMKTVLTGFHSLR